MPDGRQALPRSELVKGYEYEKDHYVVIEDEDIKKVAPKTAKVMEILEFVKADQVDPIYLESSYYVAPDEGGEKPYALLFQALQESQLLRASPRSRCTIASTSSSCGPARRASCSHTMYYQDEIRQVDEFRTDTSLVKDKELAMAKMLISSLEADFEPQKYHDKYRDNLQKMIEAKIEGNKVVETPDRAHRAGDRHHGGAEEEPRREAQAGAGRNRGGARGARADHACGSAEKARAEEPGGVASRCAFPVRLCWFSRPCSRRRRWRRHQSAGDHGRMLPLRRACPRFPRPLRIEYRFDNSPVQSLT